MAAIALLVITGTAASSVAPAGAAVGRPSAPADSGETPGARELPRRYDDARATAEALRRDDALPAADAGTTAPAFHDLSHYHAFSRVVRKPEPGQGVLDHGMPLEASQLLIVIVASCTRPKQLRVADETWCSPHYHAGVRCVAYLDCDEPPPTTAAEVVPASEYVVPWHAPHEQCCDDRVEFLSPDGWDGIGPSRYYCVGSSSYARHAAQTLPAQYRFVPALRHATSMHMRDETRWLVMVDDDSWVAVSRLLQVLGEYNYEEPLQASPAPSSHRFRPSSVHICASPKFEHRPTRALPRSLATSFRHQSSTKRTGTVRLRAAAQAPSSRALPLSASIGWHACGSTRAAASSRTG